MFNIILALQVEKSPKSLVYLNSQSQSLGNTSNLQANNSDKFQFIFEVSTLTIH